MNSKVMFFSALTLLTVLGCSNSSDSGGGSASNASVAANRSSNGPLTLSSLQTMSLDCTFKASGFATSTANYDAANQTVTITTGSPATSQTFQNVTILSGVPPYNADGFAYLAFGDVPLFSVTIVTPTGEDQDDCGQDDSGQEIMATWQNAPGGPQNVLNAGKCHVVSKSQGDDGQDEDQDNDQNDSD